MKINTIKTICTTSVEVQVSTPYPEQAAYDYASIAVKAKQLVKSASVFIAEYNGEYIVRIPGDLPVRFSQD